MSKIKEFFTRYEKGANSFDPDLMASLFTPDFMAGDPNRVERMIRHSTMRLFNAKHSFRKSDSSCQNSPRGGNTA